MDQLVTAEKNTEFTVRTVLKIGLSVISLLLTLSVLALLFLGNSFGGHSCIITSANASLQDGFDTFINRMISHAMDGVISVEMVYTLNDSDIVAPEPNQENFGMTEDPSTLQWLINKAHHQMDGQTMYFTTDTPILEGSRVRYYLDDTILVVTWKRPIDNVVYTFSEVKIQHPSQFRRFLADGKYGSDKQYLTSQMAASVNAVVASAGDFYKYRKGGVVVYNGKVERFHGTYIDNCFIDDQGDLLFSRAGELNNNKELETYVKENNVRFSLSFGPILIENGENQVPWDYPLGEINEKYARAAICQLGPLHYLLLSVNDEENYGMFPNLQKLSRTLIREGIQKAYTLDGGQTATIVMNDEVINHVSYGAQRYISDIIYFATAIPD